LRYTDVAPAALNIDALTLIFSKLSQYLYYSLFTLHATISGDYAKLVSGGWPPFSGSAFHPNGLG
jgi:hypothetical protein